jgi:pyruvate formate lyase activating enzyme
MEENEEEEGETTRRFLARKGGAKFPRGQVPPSSRNCRDVSFVAGKGGGAGDIEDVWSSTTRCCATNEWDETETSVALSEKNWGWIHSIDSMTSVDGPGLRAIIFFQGCAKRCAFCCNPDSLEEGVGQKMSKEDVFAALETKLAYYKKSGGGITMSGGECMLQYRFVVALAKCARERGLTAIIDTAAHGNDQIWDFVLPHIDMALLCCKSSNPVRYGKITGRPENFGVMMAFLAKLEEHKVPTWLRFVLMSSDDEEFQDIVTDGEEELLGVAALAKMHKKCIKGVEILPYHNFGTFKYREMHIPYKLEKMKPPSDEVIRRAKKVIEGEGVKVLL